MKKLGAVEWILIVLAVLFFAISLCVRSVGATEISVFPFESDAGIYSTLKQHTNYDPKYYKRFLFSYDNVKNEYTFLLLHNVTEFEQVDNFIEFSGNLPTLVVVAEDGTFVKNYMSSSISLESITGSNFDLSVNGTVLFKANADQFYKLYNPPTDPPTEKPTQKPTEPPTEKPTQKPGVDTVIDYSDQLAYIQAVLVLIAVTVLISLLWKI